MNLTFIFQTLFLSKSLSPSHCFFCFSQMLTKSLFGFSSERWPFGNMHSCHSANVVRQNFLIILSLKICSVFDSHTKHILWPPDPVNGIWLACDFQNLCLLFLETCYNAVTLRLEQVILPHSILAPSSFLFICVNICTIILTLFEEQNIKKNSLSRFNVIMYLYLLEPPNMNIWSPNWL